MPPGTDAVIMVEHVPDPEADPITVEAPVFPWHNVRRVGEDLVAGEMVLPKAWRSPPGPRGPCWPQG
jgi:putative molybdopterin biosynthesis protein